MNINDFKGSFSSIARSTHFRVSGFGMPEKATLTCKAASIPASNLGPIEVPYMGRKIKVAGDRTYDEWSITIINTNDWEVRSYFEDWVTSINSEEENTGIVNPSDYKMDGMIEHLDTNGNVIASYSMVGAWPSLVGPIELAWDNNDAIEEFEVTIQYDYYSRS